MLRVRTRVADGEAGGAAAASRCVDRRAQARALDIRLGEHTRDRASAAVTGSPRGDLLVGHQSALGDQPLQPGEPDLVVAARQILRGRQAFARGARRVDVPRAGRAHREREGERAALPRRRGTAGSFGLRPDGPEALHAAHVVRRRSCAPPAPAEREAGADHRVARDERRRAVLGPALGSRRPLGQHEVAHLRGRVPHAHLDVVGQRRRRSRAARRADR